MRSKTWNTYEEVAQYLLNQFAQHFQLGRVEGKHIVPGDFRNGMGNRREGSKGGRRSFLIVEYRRYTKSRLNQESMAALAFRSHDTGAHGGIVVSPLELQSGAQKVASSNVQATLAPKRTTLDYVMTFLNQIFIGVSETITASDSFNIEIIRDGSVIDEEKG